MQNSYQLMSLSCDVNKQLYFLDKDDLKLI